MWEHGQSENIRNIMFNVICSKIDKASPRCPVDCSTVSLSSFFNDTHSNNYLDY